MKIFTNRKGFYTQIYNTVKTFYPKEEIIRADDDTKDYFNEASVDISVVFRAEKVEIFCLEEKYEILNEDVKRYSYKRLDISTLAKRMIYSIFSKKTGKKSSWGILNGVRPTKLYRKIMATCNSKEETKRILLEVYLLSEEKVDILEEVYEAQKSSIARKDESITYISVPFCPSKCSYCTFITSCGDKKIDEYMQTLFYELEQSKEFIESSKIIYIGGGTPTYLPDDHFEKLLAIVSSCGSFDEFTVEAGRPETISEIKLDIMKKYGVNRISINPQTFNEETLVKIGRKHSVEDVKNTYELALKKGFDNINMDFILGLPDENLESVEKSIEEVLKLKPRSITIHCLSLKKNSKLSESYLDEHIKNNKLLKDMMNFCLNKLDESAYEKYYIYRQKNIGGDQENIGFCLKGFENHYNILMMEDLCSVHSFGAGSVSKFYKDDKIERLVFPKDLKTYSERIDELIDKRKKLFED